MDIRSHIHEKGPVKVWHVTIVDVELADDTMAQEHGVELAPQ